MYSGRGRARARGYYIEPNYYTNSSRIYTNRFRAPYSVPAGLAVDPRTVALATALGAAALLQSLPSTSAITTVA